MRLFPKIPLSKIRITRKMRILQRFKDIRSQRLIEGFYYAYMAPGERGDRSKGWLMMAVDR